eukprot:m.144649 g.144649  ORF g.144649 m.144649 type:complete len:412 (-) comp14103_c0_seq6:791-2026(-)
MPWGAQDNIPLDGGLIDGKRKSFGTAGFGWDEPTATPPPQSQRPDRVRSISESERGRYGSASRHSFGRSPSGSRNSSGRTKSGDRWSSFDGNRSRHDNAGSTSNTAFVSNLWFKSTRAEIELIFADFRTTDIRMMMDRDTKAFRGFCYVVFETPEDLTAALSLDGVLVPSGAGERALRVRVARDRKDSRSSRGSTDVGALRVDRRTQGFGAGDDEYAEAFDREVFSEPRSPGIGSSAGSQFCPSTGNPALDLQLAKDHRNVDTHRGRRRRSLTEHDEPYSPSGDFESVFSHSTGNPALDAQLAKERRSESSSGGDPSSWEPSEESRALRPKLRLSKRSVSDNPGGVSDKALSSIFNAKVTPPARCLAIRIDTDIRTTKGCTTQYHASEGDDGSRDPGGLVGCPVVALLPAE